MHKIFKSQAGIAQLAIIGLIVTLIASVGLTTYLIQQRTNILPFADDNASDGDGGGNNDGNSDNGDPCSGGSCDATPTPSPTPPPTAGPPPTVCGGSSCTQCILNNRGDILPFYVQNGWDVSCNNQDNVVNNWCSIDPLGCSSTKAGICSGACGVSPSATISVYSKAVCVGNKPIIDLWWGIPAGINSDNIFITRTTDRLVDGGVGNIPSWTEWRDWTETANNTQYSYSVYYHDTRNGPNNSGRDLGFGPGWSAPGNVTVTTPNCSSSRGTTPPTTPTPPLPTGPQCSDTINNDFDGLIDSKDPECHTDWDADNPDTYDPKIKFESRQYRLAELESDLSSTLWSDYKEDPLLTEFGLSDDSPGVKQVWVEFKETNGKITKDHITIELVEKEPLIKSVSCNFDSLNNQNLKVVLKGERFGIKENLVYMGLELTTADLDPKKKPVTGIEVLDWQSNEVTVLVKNFKLFLLNNVRLKTALLRTDQTFSNIASCDIGTSLISLGARVFCREEGKFDTDNVKVTVFDKDLSSGKINKLEETVKIDKDGVIKGLKSVLQTGKTYALSIKAPYSVRRNTTFVAEEGTTIVSSPNGQQFILPIGDIAPTQSSDGKINTVDKAELSRQWRIFEATSSGAKKNQTGDFNFDTKVNSFDWACMRYDFNSEDAPIPQDF